MWWHANLRRRSNTETWSRRYQHGAVSSSAESIFQSEARSMAYYRCKYQHFPVCGGEELRYSFVYQSIVAMQRQLIWGEVEDVTCCEAYFPKTSPPASQVEY